MAKGRPTKLTPEAQKRITDAIQMGATYRLACLYGGISEDTFARWRDTNSDFAYAIKEAEGKGVLGWLARIEQAAKDGAWQAAAWKLERRYPQEYGRQVHEVQGKDGGDVVIRVVYGDTP